MYATLVPAAFAAFLFTYFIVSPVFIYFLDRKGFRKYPAINPIAGITDLGFMWEAQKDGVRSQRLAEMHKKHPVIRIGPNSLSFVGVQQIKVNISRFSH